MGRGLHLGHARNSIAFLGFLCGIHIEYSIRAAIWGWERILGTLSLLRIDAESVPLPIKRLPKHIYGSFAGIPTRKISHRGLFLQNERCLGLCWGCVEKDGSFYKVLQGLFTI